MGMLIFQPDVGLGILAEKLLQVAVHQVQADRIDRHHADPAGHLLVQRADLIFQGVVALDQLATAFVIRLPLGSEHERAFGAVDQLDAQPLLQLVHDLAGPRLGNAVLVGGPREAPPADDVAKHLQDL